MGLINHFLEEKSYAGGIPSYIFEQQNSVSLVCRGALVLEAGLESHHSLFINKESFSSNIVHSCICWFSELSYSFIMNMLFQ